MSLYEEWNHIVQMQQEGPNPQQFWDTYFAAETDNYKTLLENHDHVYQGTLEELAQTFDMDAVTFTGFLDGINTSLKQELDLDALTRESSISLDVDFEKLYFNMLDAKATWLYELQQWDDVLTKERRHEITKEYRASKVYVNQEAQIGRNDPCPCGSGKKYKKCCGKA